MERAAATEVTLVLPAVDVPEYSMGTPSGEIVVPGIRLRERRINVDTALILKLIETSRASAELAYAPYSQFRVGAAVVMADDPGQSIHAGANVENSSFGGTQCAERVALFHAAALGFRKLRYLAVSTADSLSGPLSNRSPCGACRQAIREFVSPNGSDDSGDDALIFVDTGREGALCEVFDIERLLPFGFTFAPPRSRDCGRQ